MPELTPRMRRTPASDPGKTAVFVCTCGHTAPTPIASNNVRAGKQLQQSRRVVGHLQVVQRARAKAGDIVRLVCVKLMVGHSSASDFAGLPPPLRRGLHAHKPVVRHVPMTTAFRPHLVNTAATWSSQPFRTMASIRSCDSLSMIS